MGLYDDLQAECIKLHRFKGTKIKFRVKWKGVDFESTEDIEDILDQTQVLKRYLKTLAPRSLKNLLRRAPFLARLLKEDNRRVTRQRMSQE